MTGSVVTAGLALRELWYSLRLLAIAWLLLGAGIVAAVVPGLLSAPWSGAWFGVPLWAAAVASAVVLAGGVSAHRQRGTVGWLVLRGVPRAAVPAAWLLAAGAVLLAAIAVSLALAWIAVVAGDPAVQVDASLPLRHVAAGAAAWGDAVALAAAAVLGGLAWSPRVAAVATLAFAALTAVAALALPGLAAWLPVGGFLLVSELAASTRPIGDSLAALGVGLGWGALLVAAAAVVQIGSDL